MASSPLQMTISLAALFKSPGRPGERAEAFLYRMSQEVAESSFPIPLAHLQVDCTELPLVGDFAFRRQASKELDKVFDERGDNTWVLMADSKLSLPDGFMAILRCDRLHMAMHVSSRLALLRTPRILTTASRRSETGFIAIPFTACFK